MARPNETPLRPKNQTKSQNENDQEQRAEPTRGFSRRLTALLSQTENGGFNKDTNELAESISYEEFTAHWQTDPARCWEAIIRIYTDLDAKATLHCDEATLLNKQLIEIQNKVDTLKDQKERITIKRDQTLDQLRAINVVREEIQSKLEEITHEWNEFALQVARGSSAGNTGSQALAASGKSAKIPDPPLLSDGKDPCFKDWLLAIKQKLQANANHYLNPMMRITYITSQTEGNARKHITPCLCENAVNPY
ncbi:hypothetical protein IFM53868_06844 [Aspergillus udagawae]|uniref:Uncharacterized protein n=1 Tax=Aspergillus udagawae TaxID=91492 RepID=A0ABQ1B2D2_9EURO|nr:hypothetical protein IFM53868_06844 [Aspergillus udagawae]